MVVVGGLCVQGEGEGTHHFFYDLLAPLNPGHVDSALRVVGLLLPLDGEPPAAFRVEDVDGRVDTGEDERKEDVQALRDALAGGHHGARLAL